MLKLEYSRLSKSLPFLLISSCIASFPSHLQPYFWIRTVYPKKYAHGFCFAVLCCGYTLTDFPISIRLTSLALWQSNDCPSASKATLMNMDKYFMWIYYERLHNHNKAKHNKTVYIFLGIYCSIKGPVSSARKDCNYTCHLCGWKFWKYQYILKYKSVLQGLIYHICIHG